MDMKLITASAEQEYARWLQHIQKDDEYYEELNALQGHSDDILDAFYTELTFGTSGIRGLLGPGTNRINGYVVRRATQGVANYMKKQWKEPSCVVSYDSRKGSSFYAMETAQILNGNGIRTYLFDTLTPVSVMSYAIRELHCDMGVMITASHNPKEYNGYKVYQEDGHQVVGATPKEIFREIQAVDYFDAFPRKREGILSVPKTVTDGFVQDVVRQGEVSDREVLNEIRTVYTPLNGTGLPYMEAVFSGRGYENYRVVPSQGAPDETFATCPKPNPEKMDAFREAFDVLRKEQGDIIVATDPDADRIGVAMIHQGEEVLFSGNQLGLLMLDFLLTHRPPKKNQYLAKSIATTPLAERMAWEHGLQTRNCLSGFKHIGAQVAALRREDKEDDFYFALEESNGYLVSPFVTEKDGISGGMLAVEMAAYYKSKGLDLVDRLEEIYQAYGAYRDYADSVVFSGAEGKQVMDRWLSQLRERPLVHIEDMPVENVIDYYEDATGFPKANVLEYRMEDGSMALIRPSGTEPKLKLYTFESNSEGNLIKKLRHMASSIEKTAEI